MASLRRDLPAVVSALLEGYIGPSFFDEADGLLDELVSIERATGSFEATLGPHAKSIFLQLDLVLRLLPLARALETNALHRACTNLPSGSKIPTLLRYLAWATSRNRPADEKSTADNEAPPGDISEESALVNALQ
ncbi:MAG: hypothetical protein ACPG4T_23315, partial [Nannocystaceae bacterium]